MTWLRQKNNRIREVSSFLKENAPQTYYDFSFEMPSIENADLLTNYLGSVVAMDYGFWRYEKGRFKVDYYSWRNEQLKGANFLWIKSRSKLSEDPLFFTAQQLANLSEKDFEEWLRDDSGKIPFKDPSKRYSLILDFGQRLSKIGSLQKAYEKVKGNLRSFVYFMENFKAYSDFPFCKKAHLLCKIMERTGKWNMIEGADYTKIPPIDYHLMNMAWKLQIIELPSLTEQKLKNYELLVPSHEFVLRYKCAEAYQRLASYSELDPYKIDDIMWMESRRNCQEEPYTCENCLFDTVCHKNRTGFPLVKTHRY